MAETTGGGTRRSVLVSFAVNSAETLALVGATLLTGSAALRAQTAASAADMAVVAFLLIGVLSGARPADESHPLGYGRERFFWSLFAALGIFAGGAGLAFEGAMSTALDPAPLAHFAIAYAVLASTIALDVGALAVALRPIRREAAGRGISFRAQAQRSTDPTAMTIVVGGACAIVGAVAAALGLVATQLSGSVLPDILAGTFIGLMLIVASVVLLRANRALLLGRGVAVSILREMSCIVAAQPGVVDVPDLFAVIVGPSSLIVDGDVVFADDVTVPDLERAIAHATAALHERWPSIDYVYLTPVPKARSRRRTRPSPSGSAQQATPKRPPPRAH